MTSSMNSLCDDTSITNCKMSSLKHITGEIKGSIARLKGDVPYLLLNKQLPIVVSSGPSHEFQYDTGEVTQLGDIHYYSSMMEELGFYVLVCDTNNQLSHLKVRLTVYNNVTCEGLELYHQGYTASFLRVYGQYTSLNLFVIMKYRETLVRKYVMYSSKLLDTS